MKFASRPAFITVKKSVMKLDQDGEPIPSSNASDRPAPPQMDAPTRVRPFSVGKLHDLVEQAKEQQKTAAAAPARSDSVSAVTTKPVVLAPANTSLLRTPVKGTIVAAAAMLVFAGVGLTFALMPKQAQVAAPAAAAEPPPAVAPAADPAAPAPAASASGFVFTDPVVLLPGADGTPAAAAPATPPPVVAKAEKAPEKAAPPPERHHASPDKPATPAPVAKTQPEAKPAAPPAAAAGNEMDEMRRIQQMANSQLDKSIH